MPAAPESPPWKETPARLGWDAWFFAGADFKKFLNEDVKRIGAIIGSLELKK